MAEEILVGGGLARFIQGDVTSSASMASLVHETVRQFGRLDVMVNNAGWTHMNQPMLEVSEEDFDRCYAVNVKSIYLSAIHATPVFRRQGGGVFINIASTAGVRPRPGLTWYNGSKSAVIGTSKSMAVELGPDNIRVNCINPVFNPDTALSTSFIGGEITEERLDRSVRRILRQKLERGLFEQGLDSLMALALRFALHWSSKRGQVLRGGQCGFACHLARWQRLRWTSSSCGCLE